MKFNYKYFTYLSLTLSWMTGVAFFVLNRWFRVEGEFGEEIHAWQFPILKVHGAAAFVMIGFFGYMLSGHITKFWKKRKQQVAGLVLLNMHAVMILTAYILYYTGLEVLRVSSSYVHTVVGVLYPIVLWLHIRKKINK